METMRFIWTGFNLDEFRTVPVLDEKDLWHSLQYHLWWWCSFPFFFMLCEWQNGHSSTALIVMLRQSKKTISESFPNIQRSASGGNCCINPETGLWIFLMQHHYSTTLGLFGIIQQHYCLSFSKELSDFNIQWAWNQESIGFIKQKNETAYHLSDRK